jgi:outer membrane protein assembly factor BamB/regulator of sirC expression with transglutaminase-like and TPR domain
MKRLLLCLLCVLLVGVGLVLTLGRLGYPYYVANREYNKGVKASIREDWVTAIASYTEAIRIKPDFANAYYNRGTAYSQLQKHSAAIFDFTEAIRIEPDYANAFGNRGIAYAQLQEYDAAINDYTEAIRIEPDKANAYYNRGNAYLELGQQDKAIFDFTEAIRIEPDFAKAYYNRGNAHAQLQQYDAAIFDYTEAIRIEPDFAKAYRYRGMAHRIKGESDEAIADIAKAKELGFRVLRSAKKDTTAMYEIVETDESPDAIALSETTDWPQMKFGAARTGFNPHERKIGRSNVSDLKVLWSSRHRSALRSGVSVSGSMAYWGSYGGEFVAVVSATGRTVWSKSLPGKHQGQAVVDGVAYVTSSKKLFAFDAKSGKELWTKDPPSGQFGGPLVVDKVLYVGTSSPRTLHALNASTGDDLWNVSGGSIAVSDGVVYKTSEVILQALDTRTGSTLWETAIQEGKLTGPVVSDGVVYAHSTVGKLYAFDASDRKAQSRLPVWVGKTAIKEKGDGPQSPVVAYGKVFVGANSTFYAFDTATGKLSERNPVWTAKVKAPFFSSSAASVANGVVYSTAGNHDIYAFDAATGEVLWNFHTQGREYPMRSSPTIVNGKLFHAATFNFTLYVFHAPKKAAEGKTVFQRTLEKAATGNPTAQATVAKAYRKGEGVPQDNAEAAKWYRKAGEQGVASAQAVLGHLYRTGEGVPQDYAEAFAWDRRAAEQGIVTAQRVVGHAYRVGSGVKQDSVEAYAWFAVAASSSGVDAAQTRDEVRTEVKPQLIGQAEELAAEYIKKYGSGK